MFYSKRIIAFSLIAIIFILVALFSFTQKTNAQSSFTFGAAGDFGDSDDARAVFNAVASGTDAFFGLGDLAYDDTNAWCSFVRTSLPTTFPFELISGNHDDDVSSAYNIDTFVQCFPDKLGTVTGIYGKEYYVDYPPSAPLVRFIMVSPALEFTNGGAYSYAAGTTHYNWTASAIDGARSAGIPWVVVGMHENCITVGSKSCSIKADFFNLLVSKKVDLILQGHDHNYQRSKQLAHKTGCTAIATGAYNANCVADDGSDGGYTKGAGSVLVISGTGGKGLYNVSSSDSEAGYFVTYMGGNSNPRKGYTKFTVSANSIQSQFVGATAGTYTDSFTITSDGTVPTPLPTSAVSPTISLTPTRTPTPLVSSTPTPTFVPGSSIIIDNENPTIGTYQELPSSSDWFSSGYPNPYNTTSRANYCQPSGASAIWSVTIPTTGTWNVAAWWTAGAGRIADAAYQVTKNGTVVLNQTMDQQQNGGQFNSLGNVSFAAGDVASVKVSDTAQNCGAPNSQNQDTVSADAVRFSIVSSQPTVTPTPGTCSNPGDVDCSGSVTLNDLTAMLSNFGKTVTSRSQGDVNGDGQVNLSDLVLLLSNYGSN